MALNRPTRRCDVHAQRLSPCNGKIVPIDGYRDIETEAMELEPPLHRFIHVVEGAIQYHTGHKVVNIGRSLGPYRLDCAREDSPRT